MSFSMAELSGIRYGETVALDAGDVTFNPPMRVLLSTEAGVVGVWFEDNDLSGASVPVPIGATVPLVGKIVRIDVSVTTVTDLFAGR